MHPNVNIFDEICQLKCKFGDMLLPRLCRVDRGNLSKPLHLPLAAEAGRRCLAGEELLHGGLFEVALLGDELVQRAEQRIHIAQRPRDGALFGSGGNGRRCPRISLTLTPVVPVALCSINLILAPVTDRRGTKFGKLAGQMRFQSTQRSNQLSVP